MKCEFYCIRTLSFQHHQYCVLPACPPLLLCFIFLPVMLVFGLFMWRCNATFWARLTYPWSTFWFSGLSYGWFCRIRYVLLTVPLPFLRKPTPNISRTDWDFTGCKAKVCMHEFLGFASQNMYASKTGHIMSDICQAQTINYANTLPLIFFFQWRKDFINLTSLHRVYICIIILNPLPTSV